MTRIKLCGLSRPTDIESANALLPDYIGFVFCKSSRRYVDYQKARELKKLLNPRILAVGVFVDEAPGTVAEALDSGIIDVAQLHGSESEEYIGELRKLSGKPVIRAFRIKSADDLSAAYESSADYLLLDSGTGSGESFDWSMIRSIDRPWFLAGGLDPSNVREAVRLLSPFAVDVSSGIETNGAKDPEKMKNFIRAVRDMDEKEK